MNRLLLQIAGARGQLWALLAVACCACSQGWPPTEPEPGGGDGPAPVQELTRAFFILQHTDLSSAGWPDAFQDYRIFVCNPSLKAQHLEAVRRDIEDPILLAYMNVQDISIGIYPNDTYYQALTAAFNDSLCIRNLATGELFSFYTDTGGANVPAFIIRQPSADVLVEFHRTVTMANDWDGIYIDLCTREFPLYRQVALLEGAPSFDFDGDGEADSLLELLDAYRAGRAYFTARLRETFGASFVLVGNSGGSLDDPALNGITLEGVGDGVVTVEQARNHLLGQQQVGVEPFTAVLWATTVLSAGPSLELCREMPGLAYGVLRRN
jgi:hypothetical protein